MVLCFDVIIGCQKMCYEEIKMVLQQIIVLHVIGQVGLWRRLWRT